MSQDVSPAESVQTAGNDGDDPESGKPSIQISDLLKTFNDGEVVACEDIDLDIRRDEFVVLLGPSGCGKTTTLRCLAGLETPDEGTILIDGDDVTDARPKDRDLAFVFQDIALFPHMNVRENIKFGLDMKTSLDEDEKRNRIEETAEILGIDDLLDRKPSELSGGQQQRVSLGRAMVMEPAAFLLDEPFSALDANLRDQMRVEVKRLQRRLNRAMVFVTHDQEEAMTLGDKIVVLDGGKIQQVGSAHDIFNEPENHFVASFIGSPSTNFFGCAVEARGDTFLAETDLFTVTDGRERLEADRETVESATLGIRPDHLVVGGDDPMFEAEVTLIEPHGARDAVHLEAGGHELTAVTTQNAVSERQTTVSVGFDPQEMWVFDDRGERIV